jgi:hypothetical protein
MKLSEAAAEVVKLANTVREYWERELPKRHPDYPVMKPGEKPLPPPPEEKRLADVLEKLPDDLVFQLGLITYLGRGDFDVSDLAANYESLKENFESPNALASQLTDKAPLGEYLENGLSELKRHGIDVDKLPLQTVSVAK